MSRLQQMIQLLTPILNGSSNFPGVPKSFLKQCKSSKRKTKLSSSSTREQNVKQNKIKSVEHFVADVACKFPEFTIKHHGPSVSLTMTNKTGSRVVRHLSFREVSQSTFGFIQFINSENNS